jgi:hypothetical protein
MVERARLNRLGEDAGPPIGSIGENPFRLAGLLDFLTGGGTAGQPPLQQYAMDVRRSGQIPLSDAAPRSSAGAGGGFSHPQAQELENIVGRWAQGRMTAPEVQQEFKSRGWSVDLRRGRYDVEAFDPSGRVHYLAP